jgi:hypothetical protein
MGIETKNDRKAAGLKGNVNKVLVKCEKWAESPGEPKGTPRFLAEFVYDLRGNLIEEVRYDAPSRNLPSTTKYLY